MSFFLDFITIAVYITVIYHAYRKGLLRTLIEMAGFVASYIVAFMFSSSLGSWIDKVFLNKLVHGSLAQLASSKGSASQTINFTQIVSSITGVMPKMFQNLNMGLGNIGAKASSTIIDAISMPLASILSRAIAFFILLALCLFVVGIIARVSDTVFHIPILGTVNSIGGAAIGVIEAMFIMFLISTLISLLISLFALQKNPSVTISDVNATYIYKYVNNINPLSDMLLKK